MWAPAQAWDRFALPSWKESDVAASIAVFVVRRNDAATADPADSGLMLAEGGTSGGTVRGEARALADALNGRGLECSVRFSSAEGGHSGCFVYQAASRTTASVVFQYRPDGTVIGLAIKVRGTGETGAALRSLTGTVGPILFAADLPRVNTALSEWGGWVDGSWGGFQIVSRGPKTEVSGAKLGSTQIKVPVLHLDTTEAELADGLGADGYTCTADHETCQGKYAGQPGLALKFSGPDTGITYLVATAATAATSSNAFEQLQTTVFGHLKGGAVAPIKGWVAQHLDGRSHVAYVAGWRVDLEVATGKQTRLTLFNEEIWLVMS